MLCKKRIRHPNNVGRSQQNTSLNRLFTNQSATIISYIYEIWNFEFLETPIQSWHINKKQSPNSRQSRLDR